MVSPATVPYVEAPTIIIDTCSFIATTQANHKFQTMDIEQRMKKSFYLHVSLIPALTIDIRDGKLDLVVAPRQWFVGWFNGRNVDHPAEPNDDLRYCSCHILSQLYHHHHQHTHYHHLLESLDWSSTNFSLKTQKDTAVVLHSYVYL